MWHHNAKQPRLFRALTLSQSPLQARGEAGRAALSALAALISGSPADDGKENPSLQDALSALQNTLNAPPRRALTRPPSGPLRCWDTLPSRLTLLGDLHGRWDIASPHLRATQLLLPDHDTWSGDTAWLVQMGDLLDADLSASTPPFSDPRADALAATHGPLIQNLLNTLSPSASLASRTALQNTLNPPPNMSDADLWQHRQTWIGAALVYTTVHAFIRLEQEASAAGGNVLVLLGNHELDLLSGRAWWYRAQKRAWLALEGLPDLLPDTQNKDARPPLTTQEISSHPTLSWLASRPILAVIQNLLLMHGGPTRALSNRIQNLLSQHPTPSPDAILDWLHGHFDQIPFNHPSLAEGRSIASPRRGHEDAADDVPLIQPWLVGLGCDFILLGHSPFLGLDPKRWIDTKNPNIQNHLQSIQRLGALGSVIKLDTNLKRGSHIESMTLENDKISPPNLLLDTERASTPTFDHRILQAASDFIAYIDAHRGPELIDIEEEGLDAETFGSLLDLREKIEQHLKEPDLSTFGKAIGAVLRASPNTLSPMLSAWQAALDAGSPADALSWTLQHTERLNSLIQRIVANYSPLLIDGEAKAVRVWLDVRQCSVDGIRYGLLERVIEGLWSQASAQSIPLKPCIGLTIIAHRGQPAVKVNHYSPGELRAVHSEVFGFPAEASGSNWKALEAFAAEVLQKVELHPSALAITKPLMTVNTPQKTEQKINISRPSRIAKLTHSAFRKLLKINKDLFDGAGWCEEPTTPHTEALIEDEAHEYGAGWLEVDAPRRLRVVVLPNGKALLADTTFHGPGLGLKLRSVEARTAADAEGTEGAVETILGFWGVKDGEDVVLYARLKEGVVRALEAGEWDWLRADASDAEAEGGPIWRSGSYLFTTPVEAGADYFRAHNPIKVVFRLKGEDMRQLIERGWLTVNLMISDGGSPLDEKAVWGAAEVVPEVVALGEDGVRALWAKRVR